MAKRSNAYAIMSFDGTQIYLCGLLRILHMWNAILLCSVVLHCSEELFDFGS